MPSGFGRGYFTICILYYFSLKKDTLLSGNLVYTLLLVYFTIIQIVYNLLSVNNVYTLLFGQINVIKIHILLFNNK